MKTIPVKIYTNCLTKDCPNKASLIVRKDKDGQYKSGLNIFNFCVPCKIKLHRACRDANINLKDYENQFKNLVMQGRSDKYV